MNNGKNNQNEDEFIMSLLNQFDGLHHSKAAKPFVRNIVTHEAVVLPSGGFKIRVLQGKAWISRDTYNITLCAGESIFLGRSEHNVIVSPAKEGEFLKFAVVP